MGRGIIGSSSKRIPLPCHNPKRLDHVSNTGTVSLIMPLIIGMAGPSGAAKTTVCRRIMAHEDLEDRTIHLISCDSYYKNPPADFNPATYNFDEPNALDMELLAEHLAALKRGESVNVPVYSFVTHSRHATDVVPLAAGADVIMVEGIFAFCNPDVRKQMDVKIFCNEATDTCLVRRLRRDIAERGRDVQMVLDRYETFVKPGYVNFIKPSKRYADVIVPNAGQNNAALIMAVKLIASGASGKEIRGQVPYDFGRKPMARGSSSGSP